MARLKLTEFLRYDIKPFLYGVLMSRIFEIEEDGKRYFCGYSDFKISKYVYKDDFPLSNYADELVNSFNHYSGFYNWEKTLVSDKRLVLRFYILNDMNITATEFYILLNRKLQTTNWINTDTINEEQKNFIRGYMESRGSVDTTRKHISQDYYYSNRQELKKAQVLTEMMNLPIQYANLNARDLQPQFVSGKCRRKTQFRINLFYYAKIIGFINKYKAEIFRNVYGRRVNSVVSNGITYFDVELPHTRNDDVAFLRYINFFTNNIYQRNLTPQMIADLRRRMGFDNITNRRSNRNATLVELFRENTPDKCAVCGTEMTYTNRRTNRQHFEVHHVISFCNDREVDNIANLVKLCPTHHDMLKRNSGTKADQISAINKILNDNPHIYEFTSNYLGINDMDGLAERIWEMLG